jgi:hypothetical protein
LQEHGYQAGRRKRRPYKRVIFIGNGFNTISELNSHFIPFPDEIVSLGQGGLGETAAVCRGMLWRLSGFSLCSERRNRPARYKLFLIGKGMTRMIRRGAWQGRPRSYVCVARTAWAFFVYSVALYHFPAIFTLYTNPFNYGLHG